MANLYSYNTSSAYKLNDFEVGRRNAAIKLHDVDKRVNRTRKTATHTATRTAIKPAALLMVALCFAIAFIIVNGYVKINEAYGEIADLEAEYNSVVAANQDLQVKIDKTVDLEQLQLIAEEKYGMIRPERSQIFYVDMEQSDYAETKNDNKKAEEEVAMNGVTGTITGTMNIFK